MMVEFTNKAKNPLEGKGKHLYHVLNVTRSYRLYLLHVYNTLHRTRATERMKGMNEWANCT